MMMISCGCCGTTEWVCVAVCIHEDEIQQRDCDCCGKTGWSCIAVRIRWIEKQRAVCDCCSITEWKRVTVCIRWLKNTKRIVTAAVTQNGSALRFASENQTANIGIVLAALRQDLLALSYVSQQDFIIAEVTRYHSTATARATRRYPEQKRRRLT